MMSKVEWINTYWTWSSKDRGYTFFLFFVVLEKNFIKV